MSKKNLSFLAPILGSIGGVEKTAKELKQGCEELGIGFQCISLLPSEQSDLNLLKNSKSMKYVRLLIGTAFSFLFYTFFCAIKTPEFWSRIKDSQVVVRNSSMCLAIFLAAKFKRQQIDIVYLPSHYSLDIHRGVMSSKKRAFLPDFKSLINMYSEYLVEKCILKCRKIQIVTFSQNLKRRLKKDSINVVRPGVSRHIQEVNIEGSIDDESGTIRLLYVGRIDRGKNIELMLNLVNNSSENIELSLCGDGQLRALVEEYSNKNSNIHFLGKQFGEDLVKRYLASDFTFLPTFLESYGHVIPESLCLGKPVIGFSFEACNNAIAELIEDGLTGFILKSDKQSEFDQVMRTAKNRQRFFYQKQDQIRREALKRFNWHRFIESIVD